MQRILGYMRKAIQEFDLIQNGDRIAVGVSGGKDSLVLLKGLVLLKRFIGIDYEVIAVTLDPRFGGVDGDYSAVQTLCDELGIKYILVRTHIGEIVFDVRQETNPCSLCARMRRGALHDAAKEAGCNKIALGHHYNDAVETFVMNLFNEGRIGCFAPKSYLSRKDLTLIRPLVFAPEKDIRKAAAKNKLEVVKSKCPADGHTSREKIKQFLAEREREDNGFTDRLFGAMRRAGIDGWGFRNQTDDEEENING
jgi:tRNA 2-thiocytidine biosynthesis protein TtcA